MICKNKFSNLYTSYENMSGEYHLKAFFGMNVRCSMNEILKFPKFFNINDLDEYLVGAKIISKKKKQNMRSGGIEGHFLLDYEAETDGITPTTIFLSDLGNDFLYFFFDQHFQKNEKRKYKLEMSFVDASISKALSARSFLSETSNFISNFLTIKRTTASDVQRLKDAANIARKIGGDKEIYDYIQELSEGSVETKLLNQFREEIKKEIRFVDEETNFYGRPDFRSTDLKKDPAYAGPKIHKIIQKEFKSEVEFKFDREYTSNLAVPNLPSRPELTSLDQQSVTYTKNVDIKARKAKSIPSFNSSYSKKHYYQQEQTLKNKAPNYNLDFVNMDYDEEMFKSTTLASDSYQEEILVLVGHSNDVVTAPIFLPLSNAVNFLQSESSYLCKTNTVEAENQYFIFSPDLVVL